MNSFLSRLTWVKAITASVVASVFAWAAASPSVIDHHGILHRAEGQASGH